MSYESTVLARTPALFFRLDMVGPATNGDEIPDKSGNDLHGELVFAAGGGEPYGFASPIETDVASREFRSYSGGELVGHTHAHILRDSDPLIEPTGDLALEAWLRPGTIGHDLVEKLEVFDGACFRLRIDTQGRFVFTLRDSAGTDWNVIAPSAGNQFELTRGDSYHVVGVRHVNNLLIYVNGFLKASTVITSGLATLSEAGQFRIGAGLSGPFNFRVDEVALYTHHLSASDVLTIYESARNRLPMYATINARSSVIADLTPPTVYASFPYSHDFNSPIIERLSRPTEVIEAVAGSEERASLATKTRRTLTHSVAIMDARARRQLAGILNTNQGKPIAWPITQDELRLTAPITAGATTIPDLETDFRDYDPDGRALIFTSEFAFEQIEIESLNPLTTKRPIANDWPATARIVPLKLGIIDQELPLQAHTSRLQDANVRVSILVEEIADSPNRITPYTPAYIYRSVEAFDSRVWGLSDYTAPLSHDSVQKSELLDAKTGLFRIDSSDTEISRPGLAYQFDLDGRELISKFLGWYEERAGRLAKLWVPTFQEDFDLVSMSGSSITVTNAAYQATYNLADHRRDIALIQDDGSLAFRRITAVTPSGSNEILTVDSSVTALAATTREICFLFMSRLDADDVELAWWTDDYVTVGIRFRELPTEAE